jgi:hypothetical protein
MSTHPHASPFARAAFLAACALIAGSGAVPAADAPEKLTSRPPPPAPSVKPLTAPSEVRTGPEQRFRALLPGGSVLFVNRSTTVTLDADDLLTLSSGEVVVEARDGADLTVRAPGRTVVGRGSAFAVRAGKGGAGVAVARGSVKIDGLDAPLERGRQVAVGADKPSPAPPAALLLDWTRELRDEAGPPLVPPSKHGGGSLIAVDPDGQEAKLALRKFHLDVHVEDGFARTTIDQTYFNHMTSRLEGTFYFPLPPDASLSRLAMYVDGVRMEGGVLERDRARNIYEDIVRRQRDPALLEWLDGSTFKMRVFPLEGRQEKRIILSYTQRLNGQYGQLSYRFPSGHSLSKVADWSLHARIKGGAGLAWDCPSHAVKATKEGEDLVLSAAAKDAKLNRDVVLTLGAAEEKPAGAARFSSVEQDGAKYLMVRYRPDLPAEPRRTRRDWVFLVETSGDRDPLLARTQIEVVRGLLEAAEPGDTFAVIAANTRAAAFEGKSVPVSAAAVSKAVAFLEGRHLIGALDLGRALDEAAGFLKEAKNPYLVHVGGGFAVLGERRDDALLKRLPEGTRYVGVGVGRRWARAFLKTAAERTGGHFTQINPDESIGWRTLELSSALNGGRLLGVTVAARGDGPRFLPFAGSLTQGEELAAVARLEGDQGWPKAVVMRGVFNGRPFERELEVKDVADRAGYLPRTWAVLEIERLLAEDAVKHRDAVVELSKAMHVMTPFTSLLVLESEEMYQQYKVERGRKDHWALYPCPEKIKVVYEPLEGEEGDPSKGIKPSARRVLETIAAREEPSWLRRGRVEEYVFQSATSGRPGMPSPVALEPMPALGLVARRPLVKETLAGNPFGPDRAEYARLKSLRERMVLSALEEPERLQWNAIRLRKEVEYSKVPPDVVERPRRPEEGLLFGVGVNDLQLARLDPRPRYLEGGGLRLARALREPPGIEIYSRSGQDASRDNEGAGGLLYRRPGFSGDDRLFFDLMSHAPGLNTTLADVRAVLEAEAEPDPHDRPGVIDAAARSLLNKARPLGWQSLAVEADGDRPSFTVVFDGEGRYAWERVLPGGLRERVVCDGKTLLYLYPDLGLAARRSVSRFHRLDFARFVPQALPLAEDLAHGADLRLLDERTVALVPHGAGDKDAEGKVKPYRRVEMIVDDDGRLGERRLVEMPDRKTLAREVISSNGSVKWLDGEGKELAALKRKLGDAKPPNLKPDLRSFVVLALPFRSPEHVRKTRNLDKKALQELKFDDALALLGAYVAAGEPDRAAEVFGRSFHERDQKQLGLYVLLAACGRNLDGEHDDVLGEHLYEPLAQYLALHSSPVLRRHASEWAQSSNAWGDGPLQRLALAHALCQRWKNGKAVGGTEAQRQAERDRALDFVRRHKGSPDAWAVLGLVADRAREDEDKKKDVRAVHRALAGAWELFEDAPGLAYAARYEHARSLLKAGERQEARRRFAALYEKALADGGLPALDQDCRLALQGDGKESDEWGPLLRKTADRLIEQKRRPAVLALALQCWQLDDGPSANALLAAALDGVDDKERLPLTTAAVEVLMETGQFAEADELLGKLLAQTKFARRGDLWRLAEAVAEKRDLSARQLTALERALDAEYQELPELIDVRQVQNDYEALLRHYQKLADALVALKMEPPADFRSRVVRAADRWRSLSDDGGKACQLAGRILQTLGDGDLAWDYLTTPAALSPAEAAPWRGLAQALTRGGRPDLADRAYEAACAAEPTDAGLLWDRAENLRRSGRQEEAQKLYRRLAEGEWQPRFGGVVSQAKRRLDRP